MSVDILRDSWAARMSHWGLEAAGCSLSTAGWRMIPGFALQWLLFSQVLWRRRVHQHPRRGCLRDGAAGHRAPDHPPWHGPLLEACCPVWKRQRGDPLPRHQDREHHRQSRGPRWLEDHRYRCLLSGAAGRALSFSIKYDSWHITLQDNSLVHHSRVIYNGRTKTPANKADV